MAAIEINSKVWTKPDGKQEWTRGIVLSVSRSAGKTDYTISDESSGVIYSVTDESNELVKLQNDIEGDAISVSDLTSLSYLHEPAILHCLKERYLSDSIYTNTGPILIAINPFKHLGIYSAAEVERYRLSSSEDSTPPHVFKVANSAYQNLLNSQFNGFKNQCILVSGESGAGKYTSLLTM
jgi:myosin-5